LIISRLAAVVFAATSLLVPSAYAQQAPDDAQSVADTVAAQVIQAKVSGYASGGDGGAIGTMTASGVQTHWGTVAADWHLYPLGTRLQIEGFADQVFTVEDTGGAVHGNTFDVWFPDLATAEAFGTKSLKVTILASDK
jgi:3D (Asp-Asp-Asp) domain-containing protein